MMLARPFDLTQSTVKPLQSASSFVLRMAASSATAAAAGGVAGGASSGSKGVTEGATSSSSSSSRQMELAQLSETSTGFLVKLTVPGDAPCSGLTVTPARLPGVSWSTHELVLTVAQPPGLEPYRLRLLQPVDPDRASEWAQYSNKATSATRRMD